MVLLVVYLHFLIVLVCLVALGLPLALGGLFLPLSLFLGAAVLHYERAGVCGGGRDKRRVLFAGGRVGFRFCIVNVLDHKFS